MSESKAIDTKKVAGRRELRYRSLAELLEDAERLAQGGARTLGNWSQGQIYDHLAKSLDSSIDGIDFKMAAPLRWVLSLLFKRKFITGSIPPGYTVPAKELAPAEISKAEGLAKLQQAVARFEAEPQRAEHPIFGDLGDDGWRQFHLRHAEMHMSFIVPAEEGAENHAAADAVASS